MAKKQATKDATPPDTPTLFDLNQYSEHQHWEHPDAVDVEEEEEEHCHQWITSFWVQGRGLLRRCRVCWAVETESRPHILREILSALRLDIKEKQRRVRWLEEQLGLAFCDSEPPLDVGSSESTNDRISEFCDSEPPLDVGSSESIFNGCLIESKAAGTARGENCYFSYQYNQDGRRARRYIPGGNTRTPLAQNHARQVAEAIAQGKPPTEILKIIAGFSRKRRGK